MNRLRLCCIAIVIEFLTAMVATSVPIPDLDLDMAADGSTWIVQGQITSVKQIGGDEVPFNGTLLKTHVEIATLRSDQTIKGNLPTNPVDVRFLLPEMPVGWGAVRAKTYGVF